MVVVGQGLQVGQVAMEAVVDMVAALGNLAEMEAEVVERAVAGVEEEVMVETEEMAVAQDNLDNQAVMVAMEVEMAVMAAVVVMMANLVSQDSQEVTDVN